MSIIGDLWTKSVCITKKKAIFMQGDDHINKNDEVWENFQTIEVTY
jgi:hypothetical protein